MYLFLKTLSFNFLVNKLPISVFAHDRWVYNGKTSVLFEWQCLPNETQELLV